MSDRPLQVGDLVVHYKPHHSCFLPFLGEIGILVDIYPPEERVCCICGLRCTVIVGVVSDRRRNYDINCLKRIPPLEELGYETTDIDLPIDVC